MKRAVAKLPPRKSAAELLSLYYLDARMHLLETAAMLDRVMRGRESGKVARDPRLKMLLAGARLLADGRPERAERFQKLFSVR